MQLRKLIIYGKLRQFLGQSHFEVAVNNPRQAFAFLTANFPDIENHMSNQFYKITMGELEITEDLIEIKGDGDIKIIPVAVGAKTIVAGGLLTSLGAGTTIAGFTLGALVQPIATAIGTSMLIDGVTSIIAPTPKVPNFNAADTLSDNDPNVQANFGFASITNTARAGVPVPIIYGEVFTGSVVISSGIDTVQVEGTAT